jgi:hypothetical protein
MTPTTKAAEAAEQLARPVGALAKLHVIQTTVERVGKTGRNDHQKFDYMQEHGIIGVLRQLQIDLRCVLSVSEVPGSFVHDGNMSQALFKAEIVDTELDPGDARAAYGINFTMQATDNHGWGAAKLQTYAKKFGLQKLCGIPTEELPEAEGEGVQSTAAGGATSSGAAISKADANKLRKALADGSPEDATAAKKFANTVRAKLQAEYGVGTVDELPKASLEDFKAWVLEQTAAAA